jgi:hypothetical protein
MYGVIHQSSPYGLPNILTDEWGINYSAYPTIAQAQKFQNIAWQTLCTYTNDNVYCSPLNLTNDQPQYTNNQQVGQQNIEKVKIYNTNGNCVYETSNWTNKIQELNLPQGLYFIKSFKKAEISTVQKFIIQ